MLSNHNNQAEKDSRKVWQPDSNTVKQLQEEIEKLFDNGFKSLFDDPYVTVKSERPEPSFIEECAKISAFLMDEQAVFAQLKRLNAILAEKIKNGADANNVYLLRQTIEEELGKLGFHPNFGKVVRFADPHVFRMAIANGLLLKDPPLGSVEHGEFTHALQWLAIAWQQEDSKFLDRRAVDVFKELGEEKSVYYRATLSPKQKILSRSEDNLWDFVADSVDSSSSIKFRRPENLNVLLKNSDAEELAALTNLLNKRSKKRQDAGYYNKYSSTKLATSSPTIFNRKHDRESYEHSNEKLPKILTPKNMSIDVDDFNKRSSTQKKKK